MMEIRREKILIPDRPPGCKQDIYLSRFGGYLLWDQNHGSGTKQDFRMIPATKEIKEAWGGWVCVVDNQAWIIDPESWQNMELKHI